MKLLRSDSRDQIELHHDHNTGNVFPEVASLNAAQVVLDPGKVRCRSV